MSVGKSESPRTYRAIMRIPVGIMKTGRPAVAVVITEVQTGIVQPVFISQVVNILICHRLHPLIAVAISGHPGRTFFNNMHLGVAACKEKGSHQYHGYVFQMCHNVLLVILYCRKNCYLTLTFKLPFGLIVPILKRFGSNFLVLVLFLPLIHTRHLFYLVPIYHIPEEIRVLVHVFTFYCGKSSLHPQPVTNMEYNSFSLSDLGGQKPRNQPGVHVIRCYPR